MLHGRNAGNSIHIGKVRLCKSAEKNCSEAGSYYSCLAYLTLPKRRRQTPLSPLSCSSLSFYKTLSPFIKTILSPARPLFSVRLFRPQSPFSPNISLPSARPLHFFRKRFNRTRDLTSQKVFVCLLRENNLLGDRACAPHKTPHLFIIANIEPTLPATSSFVISPAPTDLLLFFDTFKFAVSARFPHALYPPLV